MIEWIGKTAVLQPPLMKNKNTMGKSFLPRAVTFEVTGSIPPRHHRHPGYRCLWFEGFLKA
jgi:hypothetical protein